jgi:hypothetical protein
MKLQWQVMTDDKQPHLVSAQPGYWRVEVVRTDAEFKVYREPTLAPLRHLSSSRRRSKIARSLL